MRQLPNRSILLLSAMALTTTGCSLLTLPDLSKNFGDAGSADAGDTDAGVDAGRTFCDSAPPNAFCADFETADAGFTGVVESDGTVTIDGGSMFTRVDGPPGTSCAHASVFKTLPGRYQGSRLEYEVFIDPLEFGRGEIISTQQIEVAGDICDIKMFGSVTGSSGTHLAESVAGIFTNKTHFTQAQLPPNEWARVTIDWDVNSRILRMWINGRLEIDATLTLDCPFDAGSAQVKVGLHCVSARDGGVALRFDNIVFTPKDE